ncbi:MAG: GerMN domain-containing protein [Acidimicrobiales bacterium]
MLDGPVGIESEIGITSAVPADTALLGVDLDGGVATVDLDATFEEASGAFTDELRVAQVVFTLTAFDTVDTVRFAIDGEPRDIVGSHGIDVAGADGIGVARDDLPAARPPILVETPAPGATIGDPLVVRGEANVFEANVRWALTDSDGLIVRGLHDGHCRHRHMGDLRGVDPARSRRPQRNRVARPVGTVGQGRTPDQHRGGADRLAGAVIRPGGRRLTERRRAPARRRS